MNNADREQLKEFNKKIDSLNKKVNKIDSEITKINNTLLETIKKIPKWYHGIVPSLIIAVIVPLIIVPTYLEIIESRQMDNVYFVLTTDENIILTNEKIDALYNFSILNYNTNRIKNDVTLEMSFNFEDENISVIEYEPIIPYEKCEKTDNTIKYIWDYIPEKVGDSPGRIFLVFNVVRYPKTNGTITITDASEIAPTIIVTLEEYGRRNVITPTGFLWEK